MNPDTARPVLRELMQAFRSPKVYRFLHMPVQSGSNRILESMGRRYTAEDFLGIVDAFRAAIPEIYPLLLMLLWDFPVRRRRTSGRPWS